ncbi:hypothetical protein CAPTEDRAFT_169911 [Capitella teleta]|uniref:Glucose-methanol-choline oxidoreductase N-terminal domain-containing protein n=1 Tax=Capitella teleta TaxID=283909 RepID=R7UAR6_CAPTE|nr:hypothetical protein CAPTEDRAFT_169911 [Capitella teleta]|eukprot:ELU00236.1 hypothetical protein CAPTEDRAFT_169911 [Capitella teleta]
MSSVSNPASHVLLVLKSFPSVGAGSAGCVLANRLSEDGSAQVLLLEAGDEETKYSLLDIPLTSFDHQMSEQDWAYLTEPQENASLSFKDRQVAWPRGKSLGGTSNLNFMLYVRGSPHDYNGWAEQGSKGWAYENVLPYFIKSENNENTKFSRTDFHGKDGPLTVTDMAFTPLADAFVRAGKELGHKQTDVNSDAQLGVSHSQATIKAGNRWSTVKAFLRPAMKRLNLHVATKSHVTKINFKNKRAIGVEFKRNGTIYSVRAKREVILAAGAVGSPQLLMLSGVGPKDHLDEMGIPLVTDLPVGLNLQDHLMVPTQWRLSSPVAIYEKKAKSLWSLFDHLIFGQGILSTSGVEGVGFFKSEYQPLNASEPFIQLHLMASLAGSGMSTESNKRFQNKIRIPGKVFKALFGDNKDKEGFQLLTVLLHSDSRGFIKLKSTDPFQHPIIDPKYLSDPLDAKILLEGVRLARKFGSTKVFKLFGAQPIDKVHPKCTEMEYDSDAYWLCYIREMASTLYHPAGTCKMGKAGDPSAVVDPHLRVHGLRSLRVVDASIMPRIPSGNLNAPTIMIAEKGSDLIRGIVSVDRKGRLLKYAEKVKPHHEPHDEL